MKAKRGGWYDKYYKRLLLIPFIVLLLAIVSLVAHTIATGDVINRGVSLKGGLLVTVPTADMQVSSLEEQMRLRFPEADIQGRSIEESGVQTRILVTSDITPENEAEIDAFLAALAQVTGVQSDEFSVETIGSSLGASFFVQTMKALFIAFLFMGFVVFLYFGTHKRVKWYSGIATVLAGILMYKGSLALNITALVIGVGLIVTYARYSVPSVAVILAAFSDIIITLAVVNLLGIKLSTAGIAAFLMLIGYSVDTDILLSTRVLKRTGGSIYDRTVSAVHTGLTMNATTLAAVLIALIFAQSDIIEQIMTILLIGLFADMINTWFQNAGILRWYLERQERGDRR